VSMQVSLENVLGEKIKCPKCGEEGIAAVERFKVAGKTYAYYVVRHYKWQEKEGGKRRKNTRRCVLGSAKSLQNLQSLQNMQNLQKRPEKRLAEAQASSGGRFDEDMFLELVNSVVEWEKAKERLRAFLRGEETQGGHG